MMVPVEGRELLVALPVWNTLYQVRDFPYRVRDVTGICPAVDGAPLDVRKLDKQTWRISLRTPCQPGDHNRFEVHYAIEWNDPGPFNSQLNEHHAFLNLAEVLMYVPDRRAEDSDVAFDDLPATWQIAAELPAAHDTYSFSAASYDALVDAPVEAGNFAAFEFDSGGAHLRALIDGSASGESRLEDYLRRITAYELQLMGGAPFDTPRKEYTFIFHIGSYAEVGGGGMEHANSTAISAQSIEGAAAIAAHEFFHAWNVKRIRPQSLEPVDYTKEQFTRALWFAEGVTSAYASFTLERAGVWTKDRFYDDLANQVCELESRPARKWQSLEESSLDAWFEKYDAYNSPDRSISYYDKGQILGVLLDLSIRDATDNRKSLDDVMRLMNQQYAHQGKFYNDSDGVRAAVEQVSGKNFEDFFRKYVAGTDEIPYADFFGVAGLELKIEPPPGVQSGASDKTPRCWVSEISGANERQRRIRDGILRGTND